MAFDIESRTYWGFAESLAGGTASRIKVYGEKKNVIYSKDSQESLKEKFPPIGKVFVKTLIQSSYYTFQVEYNSRKKENDDEYLVVLSSLKPIKFHNLITILKLENPSTFPLEKIQELGQNQKTPLEDGTYFIRSLQDNELFGPFIKDQKGLIPKTGKEVPVYKIDDDFNSYIFENDKLLFILPDNHFNKNGEIDCMSNEQLQEWLRVKLKKSITFDDKAIKLLLDKIKELSFNANELDTDRFKRVFDCLEQYKFSYEELKDLFTKDGFEIINNKIESMRSEIKNDYEEKLNKELEELIKEKQIHEKEKHNILAEIKKFNIEKEKIQSEISDIEITHKQVDKNYDSLLLKLKVDAKINTEAQSIQSIKIKPLPFVVDCIGKSFDTIKREDGLEHFDLIEKNLTRAGYKKDEILHLYKSENGVLLKAQAVFIPCISWAYIYAQSIGNAKIYTMHIEHDWLHYRDFCDNGLIDIWIDAINNSEINYILVFEAINITQPECGMMPILDVIESYRPFLEGTKFGLPDNLKIFATILPCNENEIVGLKLSKRLFKSWGTFAEPSKQEYFIPLIKLDNAKQYGYFNPTDIRYQPQEPGDSYFGI